MRCENNRTYYFPGNFDQTLFFCQNVECGQKNTNTSARHIHIIYICCLVLCVLSDASIRTAKNASKDCDEHEKNWKITEGRIWQISCIGYRGNYATCLKSYLSSYSPFNSFWNLFRQVNSLFNRQMY